MPAYYDEAQALAEGGHRSRRRLWAALAAVGAIAAAGAGYWTVTGAGGEGDVPFVTAGEEPSRIRPDAPAERARYAEVRAYRVVDGDVPGATEPAVFSPEPDGPAEEDLPMSKIAAVTTLPSAPRPPAMMAPPGSTMPARPAAPAIRAPALPGRPADAFAQDGARLASLGSPDRALLGAPEAMGAPRVHRLIPSEMDLLDTTRPARVVSRQDAPNPPRGVGSEIAPPVSPVARGRPETLGRPLATRDRGLDLVRAAERSAVQIQLGAFPELEIIESEWRRLSEANSDVLGDRAMAVQQTVAGGVTYYRLRVGPFADGREASTVCQALKTRGYDCLVAINTESRG
ncbi:MAG: SPOR domain-containing protein [Paracoccaceae bacterium]